MGIVLDYPDVVSHKAKVVGILSLAIALQVGTGGVESADYYKLRGPMGYAFASYATSSDVWSQTTSRSPVDDLMHIRTVLNPTITDLASALGVSRQAIYDWQNGKEISAENTSRLYDMARAADMFAAEGLTTSAQLLRRPIFDGKAFYEIARLGGSAEDAALKLVNIVRGELQQRQRMSVRLSNRKPPTSPLDNHDTPILDESN